MIDYQLYNHDCRSMYELEDESVQMVCTSPPYWGLRKYSGEQDLIWGGDKKCEHQWESVRPPRMATPGDKPSAKSLIAIHRTNNENRPGTISNTCSLCGAWRGAYGLEPTPELYVQHTIEILREIRRVLRKDGVVFWNIGDSYAGSGGAHKENHANPGLSNSFKRNGVPHYANEGMTNHYTPSNFGLKPKDLCLIPFRVAISAQEDNWWVRSVIIWNKPNPMPESVRDRPTESHEYILMLTKSTRYYWDQEAVREKYTEPLNRWGGPEFRGSSHKYIELGGHDGEQHYGATSMFRKGRPVRPIEGGRNLRSVWTFPTRGFPEAHFATFPEKLPEICIKAATPEVGCCSKCGKPWVRIVETHYNKNRPSAGDDRRSKNADRLSQARGHGGWRGNNLLRVDNTLGWQPTCKCNADKVPSIVLDPFAGAGTTLKVALQLGRNAVGYELSSEYCQMIRDRLNSIQIEATGL